MFNKKNLIIVIFLMIFLIIGGISYVVFIPDPVNSASEYLKALENDNYEKAYSLLSEESKEKISIDEIKESYENLYNKASINNKKYSNLIVRRDDFFTARADYDMSFKSSDFGKRNYKYNMVLKREGLINWKVKWNYNLIFPEMTKE